MYDRLYESNNSNDDREIQHIQEQQHKRKWSDKSSYEKPKKNRTVRNQNIKITEADNAPHQTGQECTTAGQNPLNVVIAKEGDITRKCADHGKKYSILRGNHHRQKKTIATTIQFRR